MTGSSKKSILFSAGLIFLLFLILALRPINKATSSNCQKQVGMAEQVRKGDGEADIVIQLKGDKNYYYINRGIDYGLSLKALQNQLTNRDIELLTIKHWTPLDPLSKTKHIAQIRLQSVIIYSELKE